MKRSILVASVMTSSGAYVDRRLNFCTYSLTELLLDSHNPKKDVSSAEPLLEIIPGDHTPPFMTLNPSHQVVEVPPRQ